VNFAIAAGPATEAIKGAAIRQFGARKPATEQVALANQLLTEVATPEQCWTEDGNDCRTITAAARTDRGPPAVSRNARCAANRYWSQQFESGG